MVAPSTPHRPLQPFIMEPAASPSVAGPLVPDADDDDENGEDNIFRDMSFEEILEDLNARFLANLPEEEMTMVRLYWQAEQAHWFYEDYLRPLNPLLPSLSQRQFTHLILASSPLYEGAGIDYDAVWEEYCAYKRMVPCCGGILINATHDKVLMVRGWKSNAGWCFPRGKINSEESEVACAIREVEEETGFDLAGSIHANDFIKTQINAQEVTMFIVKDIDESTVFETQTRNEIGAIEWVPFLDLPAWTHKKGPKRTPGHGQKKFYNVTPFVGPLKKWLTKQGINPHPKRRAEAAPATRQRELQPFSFDDKPHHAHSHAGHQHPTTQLDHLFAKFIQKDENVVALESDNARTLDQLFGGLAPSAAPQTAQASEDDALARLLGGLTTAPAPAPVPAIQLPEKQSKLLAMLGGKPGAAAPPPASTHQTNLLSMLGAPPSAAPPLPLDSAPAPAVADDSDRQTRQQALLQSLFMGPASAPVTPPGPGLRPQVLPSPASGMISPMPPMPPSQAWQAPPPSGLGMNGSPSRLLPQTPPQLMRGGGPNTNTQAQAQALNQSLFTPPPPGALPPHLSPQIQPPSGIRPQYAVSPQQQPRQAQAYPQSSPRVGINASPNVGVNNHQRALLGTLFNGAGARPPMPGMMQPMGFPGPPGPGPNGRPPGPPFPPPPGHAHAHGGQFYGMPPPGAGPGPGPQIDQFSPQMQPQMGGYYPTSPPYPGQPPMGMMPQPPQMPPQVSQVPQQQQQQQRPPPGILASNAAAGPRRPPPGLNAPAQAQAPVAMPVHPAPQPQPLAPGSAVHQPVPRPPVGGGLLGLINGTST